MFRDPWFSIISVTEVGKGPSIGDIVCDEAKRFGVAVAEVRRGARRTKKISGCRASIYRRAFYERPDLSSEQIGGFVGVTGWSVRHSWRKNGLSK